MSNLHRRLAPISDAAWKEIEQEASRTFRRNVAGRRMVDMPDPAGETFSALTTGHTASVTSPVDSVRALRREVLPVIELRAPFTVTRTAIDDVDRGSVDSDWQPVKDAAAEMARSEDTLVFSGLPAAGINGVVPASTNEPIAMPERIEDFPNAVAAATSALRLVGVDGPYSLALPAALYTEVSETIEHGVPVFEHVLKMLRDGHIIWAPSLSHPVLVSERGGDYELHLGQELSLGYLSHDDQHVRLYLQESLTVRVATAEASVLIK